MKQQCDRNRTDGNTGNINKIRTLQRNLVVKLGVWYQIYF